MTKQTTKAELEAENKRLLTTNDALYKLCVQNLSETGFFRWNCIILSCIGLLMSILMWWCE